EQSRALDILVQLFRSYSFFALVVTYYLFPNGRFVPGATRWLALVWAAITGAWIFIPALRPPSSHLVSGPEEALLGFWFFLWVGTGVLAQIYRYRRVRDPIEKQQSKWVVFNFMAFGVLLGISFIPPVIYPELQRPGPEQLNYALFAFSLGALAFTILPLTLLLSILRYRLWDIDIIINRALVYGVLTGLLALIYFALVTLLQSLISSFSGPFDFAQGWQQTPVAIVVSTLVIAALFNPFRSRIQTVIDRRFYRRKYVAEKALAAFSASIRDRVDPQSLSEALLNTVKETLQPANTSIWLRESGRSNAREQAKNNQQIR
ncbi:MAG: hypothetical protein R3335_00745, partial [Anaerolineales bacterium]|nr:hypothetical protein [Anaerolineales bacterium]